MRIQRNILGDVPRGQSLSTTNLFPTKYFLPHCHYVRTSLIIRMIDWSFTHALAARTALSHLHISSAASQANKNN